MGRYRVVLEVNMYNPLAKVTGRIPVQFKAAVALVVPVALFAGVHGAGATGPSTVTMPTGGTSVVDISTATNSLGATVDSAGGDMLGVIAEGSGIAIARKYIKKTRGV